MPSLFIDVAEEISQIPDLIRSKIEARVSA